jgi:hypothetical protein
MTIIMKSGGPLRDQSPDIELPMSAATATPQSFASSSWGRPDGWLLAYLFLPVPIFLIGFLSLWAGVPAAVLALVAFVRSRPFVSRDMPQRSGQLLVGAAVLMVFAAAWTSLGGAGHFFHANAIDWIPRYGVLRDLVVNDWPPRYLDQNGSELVLRAPLAYYLVPALMGKLAGIAWADLFLLLWTWLGVSLFFLANIGGTPGRRLLVLILFAAASGLDIAGFLWMSDGYLPNPGHHIEWWTGRMKYSSNSTMLYWIPNHVLPGWALGAWLWRLQHSADLLRRLPLIGLAVMIWSPLPFVGALPMIAVLAWHFRVELLAGAGEYLLAMVYVLIPGLLIATYLLMSAGGIKSWAVVPPGGGSFLFVEVTLMFLVLEVLVFGIIAGRCSRSAILVAGLVWLCLLPFVGFGPTNDLATLGAIPALTMMWLILINELTSPSHQRRLSKGARVLLIVLFVIGAATPFQETYRAMAEKRWDPDQGMPAPVALEGFPAHYFASADNRFAPVLKRSPPLSADEMDWSKSDRLR